MQKYFFNVYKFCNTMIQKNDILFSDNVPTILLASWLLQTVMWDGEDLKGPFPTLFSEDRKKAEDNLRGSMQFPFKLTLFKQICYLVMGYSSRWKHQLYLTKEIVTFCRQFGI